MKEPRQGMGWEWIEEERNGKREERGRKRDINKKGGGRAERERGEEEIDSIKDVLGPVPYGEGMLGRE